MLLYVCKLSAIWGKMIAHLHAMMPPALNRGVAKLLHEHITELETDIVGAAECHAQHWSVQQQQQAQLQSDSHSLIGGGSAVQAAV